MESTVINHPLHYGGDTTYEAIKVIEAWGLNFNLGNAAKYISRAGRKPGSEYLHDLRKAAWYLNREIGRAAAFVEPNAQAQALATVAEMIRTFEGPVAKPAKVEATAAAVVKVDQPAPGAAKKISRKAAKSAKADYKKAKADRQAKAQALSRTCPHCQSMYIAKRKDQTNCLAPKCRKAAKDLWKETHADARIKAQVAAKAAQTVAQERGENGGLTRIERIRAAAERMDGIPESVRAAVAEARESEVM